MRRGWGGIKSVHQFIPFALSLSKGSCGKNASTSSARTEQRHIERRFAVRNPVTIKVLTFNAFTSEPDKGNPAGIVLGADNLDDRAMQAIAAATGFNDTAFITTSQIADFRIRYFSPRKEVELCGHATIAAAIALQTRGHLACAPPCGFSLETKAGVLPVMIDLDAEGEQLVHMSQLPSQFKAFDGDRNLLAHALGIAATDLHLTLPIMYGTTGRWTLIVPVHGLDTMWRMHPRPAVFAEVVSDMPGASIHPFCLEVLGEDVDLHARHFSSPSSGTVEDPVTGTASGVLGAYYRTFIDPEKDASQGLLIEQGYEIGREGHVRVWATRSNDRYTVRIAGTACFVEEREYSAAETTDAKTTDAKTALATV